jgi:hypothetical protein
MVCSSYHGLSVIGNSMIMISTIFKLGYKFVFDRPWFSNWIVVWGALTYDKLTQWFY